MTDLNWNVSADDAELIDRIVVRGRRLDNNRNVRRLTRLHCVMDITAVHANGAPLRLADFLAADDLNFAHDWFGIRRNLDRETGALINHFRPRFAEARAHWSPVIADAEQKAYDLRERMQAAIRAAALPPQEVGDV